MYRYLLIPAALAAMSLAACDESVTEYELTGRTMGTQFSIKIVEQLAEEQQAELQRDIEAVLEKVELAMSTYLLQSEISRFNMSDSTDWLQVSEALCLAVEEALGISRLTDGAFDVTVGPLVNVWGFGPEAIALEPPPDPDIAAARARVGFEHLHADCTRPALRKDRPDIYVDLSAYAKGFGVDRVAELLDDVGIRRYLVEIGGELRMRGKNANEEPWRVAIESPTETGRVVRRIISLSEKAMATSGDYRNFFEYEGHRYSHTIDPRTGWPATHALAAVTVVSDTAAKADALATALLVLGPDDGYELAVRENISAYFQLRGEDGDHERMTPAFQ